MDSLVGWDLRVRWLVEDSEGIRGLCEREGDVGWKDDGAVC